MNGILNVKYLRNPLFDFLLIFGVLFLALLAGWICLINPTMFTTILFIDLWFLGYHHVIATYTRIAFDKQNISENSFFIYWLPIIIVLSCTILVLLTGPWILATTYLYWQWFSLH